MTVEDEEWQHEKNRERLRAEGLATYVKKNGLAVTMYQDYGWPAKKIEQ